MEAKHHLLLDFLHWWFLVIQPFHMPSTRGTGTINARLGSRNVPFLQGCIHIHLLCPGGRWTKRQQSTDHQQQQTIRKVRRTIQKTRITQNIVYNANKIKNCWRLQLSRKYIQELSGLKVKHEELTSSRLSWLIFPDIYSWAYSICHLFATYFTISCQLHPLNKLITTPAFEEPTHQLLDDPFAHLQLSLFRFPRDRDNNHQPQLLLLEEISLDS